MKVSIILLIAIIVTYATAWRCVATGDPHYTPLSGQGRAYYDLYNQVGNLKLLQHTGHNFLVETVLEYYHPWANRALQTSVAIRIGNHILESIGGKKNTNARHTFSIDGKKMVGGFGRKTLTHGVYVHSTYHNGHHTRYQIVDPKNGVSIILDALYSSGIVYHNIYIDIPSSWVNKVNGLCVEKRGRNPIDIKIVQKDVVQPSSHENLFPSSYKPKGDVPHRLDHVSWKNEGLKREAERYCHSKGLRDNLYKDCVYDIKLAGSIKGAVGYDNAKKSMSELIAMGKANGSGHLHAIYVMVNRMKKEVQKELKQAEKVHNDLVDELNKLSADLATTEKMVQLMNMLHTKSSPLAAAMNGLKIALTAQKAKVAGDVAIQKKIIDEAKGTLKELEEVLGFVGKMIMEKRNA